MTRRPKQWVDFMMRFELGLERPDPRRARRAPCHRAAPTSPAACAADAVHALPRAHTALLFSVRVTLIALAVFGYVKGRYTGAKQWKSALQTTLTGGLAAAAAFPIARAIA